MKHTIAYFAIALLAVMVLSFCATDQATHTAETAEPTEEEIVARGAYLVSTSGCHDCHSPKRMGPEGPEIIPELVLSGYPSDRPFEYPSLDALQQGWVLLSGDLSAAIGPWGVSFSANITSDETGIGSWEPEQFVNALKKGLYKGLDTGRPIMPPMPIHAYKNFTEDDILAIFAYLKTSNPVHNVVPAYIPPDQM